MCVLHDEGEVWRCLLMGADRNVNMGEEKDNETLWCEINLSQVNKTMQKIKGIFRCKFNPWSESL